MDVDECILAVKQFGKKFIGFISQEYYPTGCYLYRNGLGDDEGFFNRDLSDVGRKPIQPICKQGIFNHFSRVKNKLEKFVSFTI